MNPESYEFALQNAMQESAAGHLDRSISLLQTAADFNPATGVPYFLMGAAYAQAQQPEKAEAAYATALIMSPDLLMARFQLGLLQLTGGRAAVSMLTWQPLLAQPEGDPVRSYVLGYQALAHNQFQDAIDHFAAGLRQPQDNQPLMRDIEKTMQAIMDQQEGLTSPEAGPAPDEQNISHVLLSNYQSDSTH